MSVTVRDLGLNKILERDRGFNKLEVAVGLFSDTRSNDNTMNMAQLGSLMEYGDQSIGGDIPSRPFMAETADHNESHFAGIMEREFSLAESGETALKSIGREVVRETKITIERFHDPKNAKRTIERKHRDDPLMESGKMRDSVKFKIRRKK